MISNIISWSTRFVSRRFLVVAHDILIASVSVFAAFYLRLNFFPFNHGVAETLFLATLLFVVIFFLVAIYFELHQGMWRFASIPDLVLIAKTATVSIIALYLILFAVQRLDYIPRSVPFIQWGFLILALGGSRLLYRLINSHEHPILMLQGKGDAIARGRLPVLLIGADHGAATFIRASQARTASSFRILGILSASDSNRGRRILGAPVLGGINELPAVIERLSLGESKPARLVITDQLEPMIVKDVLEIAHSQGIMLCRMPEPSQLRETSGEDAIELQPIALEDLLGRPAAALDQTAIGQLIKGRRVLITGAGGSIGSELVRQIASRNPNQILLLDQGEFNLYQIDHEIAANHPDLPRHAILCDVRDRKRVFGTFARYEPELVFHAAALKHVPMVEINPSEGVMTNAIGTRNVADAASQYGVGTFVQVSTDKAVNPTNVMGASKRLAEFYCQALDLEVPSNPSGVRSRFMTVRFGNVLGSSGSVVPLFQKQLEAGGPLTVTHPDIKRYFMTIPEAVSLILHASAHGSQADDDERGRILVLDMGEPVKITDLAHQMIRIAGLEPEKDIKIVYSGLRPGEKLFEELFDDAEERRPAAVTGLFMATSRNAERQFLGASFDRLQQFCSADDTAKLRREISMVIPGYDISKEVA